MRLNGAQIAVKALESLNIKFTFGIPGTHTTELYDALGRSEKIKPILVTHEGGAAFMADAVSRTSDSVGCLTIVPAAGVTNALSGIGEAYLAGIPMLIITGGIRRDSGRHYQLHQIELEPIVKNVTKAQFLITKHTEIVSTIYNAYDIALSGEPGPVFIEIASELLLFSAEVGEIEKYTPQISEEQPDKEKISETIKLLLSAKYPMLYLGWGAKDAEEYSIKIAEKLGAPVAVTLQGKSVFPNNHPLFTGCFLGRSAKPSGQAAYKSQDVLLAVGCRFSEISTGSYGIDPPKNLIHVDINKEVFNKNYPAKIAIEGDAKDVLKAIWEVVKDLPASESKNNIEKEIQSSNEKYFKEWLKEKQADKVSPGWFFDSLNKSCSDETLYVLDDGKHTFLAAELLDVHNPGQLISPTDFNCMGYCIPAAVGVQLANPDKRVIAITGDGAAQMHSLELVTATTYDLAPLIFIFNDGELGQIAQFQKIPLKTKTATIIGNMNFEGLAMTTGSAYLRLENDLQIDEIMQKAFKLTEEKRPVIIDVNIDYSQKTAFTKGVIKTNLSRFPLREKIRFITRAIKRHTIG